MIANAIGSAFKAARRYDFIAISTSIRCSLTFHGNFGPGAFSDLPHEPSSHLTDAGSRHAPSQSGQPLELPMRFTMRLTWPDDDRPTISEYAKRVMRAVTENRRGPV